MIELPAEGVSMKTKWATGPHIWNAFENILKKAFNSQDWPYKNLME